MGGEAAAAHAALAEEVCASCLVGVGAGAALALADGVVWADERAREPLLVRVGDWAAAGLAAAPGRLCDECRAVNHDRFSLLGESDMLQRDFVDEYLQSGRRHCCTVCSVVKAEGAWARLRLVGATVVVGDGDDTPLLLRPLGPQARWSDGFVCGECQRLNSARLARLDGDDLHRDWVGHFIGLLRSQRSKSVFTDRLRTDGRRGSFTRGYTLHATGDDDSGVVSPRSKRDSVYRCFLPGLSGTTRLRRVEQGLETALMLAVAASVVVVVMESVESFKEQNRAFLDAAELTFLVLFSVEYVGRVAILREPLRYMTSVFGLIDLAAIVPAWVSLLLPSGIKSLIVIRGFRLLRVFRLLKMSRLLSETSNLRRAVVGARNKIIVFQIALLCLVLLIGSVAYTIEDAFDNIPIASYWVIATVSTVGYGDVVVTTLPARILAALVMALGYSLMVVPNTVVVTGQGGAPGTPATPHAASSGETVTTMSCRECARGPHEADAGFCKYCGGVLVYGAQVSYR